MIQEPNLSELEHKIGYSFKDKNLLKQALTHKSYANELKINKTQNYERIEFLGDAVLELVTSSFLFKAYPEMPEGQMTKKRASIVCEPALAFCAKDIEIGKYILLGRGEASTGGRDRDSITSDVMEAVIGAIYLDGGFEEASSYINRFILSDLESKVLFYDSKTLLQEVVQRDNHRSLCYDIVEESGPDHDKQYIVEAKVNNAVWGRGAGRTKKAAEQQAAYEALLKHH